MTSFADLMSAVEAREAARAAGMTTGPTPTPAPEPKVDALEWSRAILGRYHSVATEPQRRLATATLNRDDLVGATLKPPGPSLAELRAMLDAREPEPAVAIGPGGRGVVRADEGVWMAIDGAGRTLGCWATRAAALDFLAATAEPEADGDPVVPPDADPCAGWPEWTDADVWQPGPDEPEPVALPLDEWVRGQAELYRSIGSDACDLVAEALEALLAECEILHAKTPAQLRDRRAALLASYEPRGGAPTRGRSSDDREPCGVLAGHPARYDAVPAGEA